MGKFVYPKDRFKPSTRAKMFLAEWKERGETEKAKLV
jgi:hypothetical protein